MTGTAPDNIHAAGATRCRSSNPSMGTPPAARSGARPGRYALSGRYNMAAIVSFIRWAIRQNRALTQPRHSRSRWTQSPSSDNSTTWPRSLLPSSLGATPLQVEHECGGCAADIDKAVVHERQFGWFLPRVSFPIMIAALALVLCGPFSRMLFSMISVPPLEMSTR